MDRSGRKLELLSGVIDIIQEPDVLRIILDSFVKIFRIIGPVKPF